MEAQCLEFHRNPHPVITASMLQVRKSIYTDSLSKWKPYAPDLSPLIEALGPR